MEIDLAGLELRIAEHGEAVRWDITGRKAETVTVFMSPQDFLSLERDFMAAAIRLKDALRKSRQH